MAGMTGSAECTAVFCVRAWLCSVTPLLWFWFTRWRYSRKIHYLADIGMALSWGLCCGFDAFLPYFYVCFFAGFLSTRVNRDNTR